MYTGLVEELGSLAGRDGDRYRFTAGIVLSDAAVDDSIAVNGCCLTVVEMGDGWWEADVSAETARCTALGSLQPGDPVNLERSMRYADRLGGHLVQGHVDGVATVVQPGPDLRVAVPPEGGLRRYIVEKGSVTLDGVSLTCFDITDDEAGGCEFSVALIPHTMSMTTMGTVQPGDPVNLEADVLARYVERLLGQNGAATAPADALGAGASESE
ncbi:riboflavin synthase [Candidatus Poriferisodalis sp.]|uniref:riboflavin synthase n=1 Tax=Candidatus Poriferisodalis sp. TaxID=3101277 RepID=UPI003B02DA4A